MVEAWQATGRGGGNEKEQLLIIGNLPCPESSCLTWFLFSAGLCCCFIVGLCIFFPILFTITLEDADDIDSIGAPLLLTRHAPAPLNAFVLVVETMCNYQSVQDHPYWLCQRQDVQCQEGQGCESEPPYPNLPPRLISFGLYSCDGYSNANGDCDAWLTARTADGSATTDREVI